MVKSPQDRMSTDELLLHVARIAQHADETLQEGERLKRTFDQIYAHIKHRRAASGPLGTRRRVNEMQWNDEKYRALVAAMISEGLTPAQAREVADDCWRRNLDELADRLITSNREWLQRQASRRP